MKNGGDLGRAELPSVTALELQILIPHIANILENLHHLRIAGDPFKYAIEIQYHQRKAAELVIMSADLPPDVSWYEADGSKLFAIRGASGGVTTSYICYLITK